MNGKASASKQVSELRRHAETRLRQKTKAMGLPTGRAETIRVLHELQVHQVELEMQNEELRLTRDKTETFLSGKLHEERIRVEALLAEYTDLYDYAPTGYLTVDRVGAVRRLNFAGARLLGSERSKLLKKRLGAFIAMGDRRTFADFLERVFTGQTNARCEVTLAGKNGRSVAVLIEGICYMSRQECRLVMFDISERKRSEQTRGQFAKIVEFSSDAVMSATPEGIVTSWNKAAERICGFTADEIIGRSISAIAPPDRRAEQRGYFERIRRGETVDAYETVRLRKNGQTFAAAMTIFPIKNLTGGLAEISCIMRDITTRKNLEHQLVEIAERERRELGRELHDGLGQHLHALHFLATLFQKDLKQEESPCAAAAARLSTLLREAATLTRDVAHGLQPVRPVPEGLMTALSKLTDRTQTLFRVDCALQCRTPVLVANTGVATHLYRIAQEAVNNAVTHARPKQITLTLRPEAGRIVLTIKDDGTGISTRRRKDEGMGLHVMQHRANAIGGMLTIQYVPDGGTEVICSVPEKIHAEAESKPTRKRR